MMKGLILLALLALVVAAVVVGCKATRSGYESPKYTVVKRDGRFEVRDYPALVVAQTPINDMNGGFMTLFRFITGANASGKKIAMTTPVLMSDSDTNRSMAFVMPASYAPGELPRPADPGVELRTVTAGRFAVLDFTGGRSAGNESQAAARLQAWLKLQSLVSASAPVFAYYDPPWIPTFLRRNEVMLRIQEEAPAARPTK
jgi:hypothetical protein